VSEPETDFIDVAADTKRAKVAMSAKEWRDKYFKLGKVLGINFSVSYSEFKRFLTRYTTRIEFSLCLRNRLFKGLHDFPHICIVELVRAPIRQIAEFSDSGKGRYRPTFGKLYEFRAFFVIFLHHMPPKFSMKYIQFSIRNANYFYKKNDKLNVAKIANIFS
jgi:hypothetical protein